jgi:hypothetical protein
MKYVHSLVVAGTLILGLQLGRAAAQTNSQPVTAEPLKLSEQQKELVIAAAIEAKTRQKTPKEFKAAVGASMPKEVYLHAFHPEIARKVPTLKHHWYAYLNREIVLIDASQATVVAVVPLPEKFVSDDQQHQGAAEPGSSKNEHGGSSTESVPSHTSPETIK